MLFNKRSAWREWTGVGGGGGGGDDRESVEAGSASETGVFVLSVSGGMQEKQAAFGPRRARSQSQWNFNEDVPRLHDNAQSQGGSEMGIGGSLAFVFECFQAVTQLNMEKFKRSAFRAPS